MALAVYSSVFANKLHLTTPDTYDVPCPEGFRMVVRDIDASAGVYVTLPALYVEDMTSTCTFVVLYANGTLRQSTQWQGRQVFEPGGGFTLNAADGVWDIRVSGYLLAL